MTIEQFIKMLSKEDPKARILMAHWNGKKIVDRVPTHLLNSKDGFLRIGSMPRFRDQ